MDDIAVHFVIGLAAATSISMVIPDNFFAEMLFGDGILSMLLMVAIGILMYICSTSSIPIAVALIIKGISPGSAYVFRVAGPTTNAATISILTRILGRKHTEFYVGTIVMGSSVFRLLMDVYTQGVGWGFAGSVAERGMHFGVSNFIFAGIFALLLLTSFSMKIRAVRNHFLRKRPPQTRGNPGVIKVNAQVLNIEGMTSHHCKAIVTTALKKVAGTEDVIVVLDTGKATMNGLADHSVLTHAVYDAGDKMN